MPALLQMLLSLALCLLIECGLSLLWQSRQLSYCVLLCNLLTNPPLCFTLLLVDAFLGYAAYMVALATLEITAVVVEAVVIAKMTGRRPPQALGLSTLLNLASFAVGLLLW